MTTVFKFSPDFTHYLKFLEFDLMIDRQVTQQLNRTYRKFWEKWLKVRLNFEEILIGVKGCETVLILK